MKADSTIKIKLNERNIYNKVQNDRFGLFVSHNWKRLINPFTPHRDGPLEDTAQIRAFEIEYIQNYSIYVYNGETFNFRRDTNPYATYEWDKAAEKAGQKEKLIKSINEYLARR